MNNDVFKSLCQKALEYASDEQWSAMIDEWLHEFKYTGSKYMIVKKLQPDVKISQYPGVTWYKQRNKWCARYWNGKVRIYLGLYKNEIDAKVAIDSYVRMSDSTTP